MNELQRQVEQLQTYKQEMQSSNEALSNEKQALEQQVQSAKLQSSQLQEVQTKFESEREQLENNLKLESKFDLDPDTEPELAETKEALAQAVRQLNQLKQEQGTDA
ncbi:hypothetical protein CYMTET_5170 [Cymbomonas tetramitiformis]|uniref:Uncharacterized protein n=1 Tax=Cymbomonas tetramitiformis TaxID=36881 RepID=A0AAE0LJC4_9CHLO|nr:hypothetical protein CYMTET_5170 [Cymbomonas tetramitiformis]